MKKYREYVGILVSVIFALIIRILAEFNIIEINSFGFFALLPAIIGGYLPFVFGGENFIYSKEKVMFFPFISIILFFIIAYISRLEDLGCFIILGIPFLFISVITSLIIRYILIRKNRNNFKKNSLFILVLPIFLGQIEKNIEKSSSNFEITNSIIINESKEKVWNILFSVPNLQPYIKRNFYNYISIPSPIKSTFDPNRNERIGYFENGISLNENIIKNDYLKELSFKINIEKSNFKDNQTMIHVLKNENLKFNSILYKIVTNEKNQTVLILTCNYELKSNIPYYGDFWSKKIINDFEIKLLNALKQSIESQKP